MAKVIGVLLVLMTALAGIPSASAGLTDPVLYGWSFNVNGRVIRMPVDGALPSLPGFDLSRFDRLKGTGVISYTFVAQKNFNGSVHAFLDHELHRAGNTFFNEYGMVFNTPAEGQSWEIDEPGYKYGDIYRHFSEGNLDGANGVAQDAPDDVSMAMGWKFTLRRGYKVTIRFIVSDAPPASGFYLSQNEDGFEADGPLYFWSEIKIEKGNHHPCDRDDHNSRDWSHCSCWREDEHGDLPRCRECRHSRGEDQCGRGGGSHSRSHGKDGGCRSHHDEHCK